MDVALVHMRHAATGGTERYLNALAGHLAEAGHAVTIVCRRHASAPHPAVRFAVLRGPALASVGSAGRMWAFARAVERHARGTRYDVIYGLGRTWTQDIVRLGGGCHATYLERAHAATLRPLERALGLSRRKERLALEIEARALSPGAARAVVANSEMVRRDVLRRYDLDPERVHVIRNGVDLERFRPDAERGAALRARLGLPPGEPAILFLGNGYLRKGLDRVLDALPALLRRRPGARLLVVGRDARPGAFAARARRLGVAGAVHFLGSRTDTEAWYAAADLYVLPTRYDAFANTTLEALASGLPVVTSDANGAAEILAPGETGAVLAEPLSTAALGAALVEWSERERCEKARGAARRLAERHPIQDCVEASARLLAAVAAAKQAEAGGAEAGRAEGARAGAERT